jgi:NAD(P)H-dependent flavin oxidoreductase YrpB (nitropropane dioxygenase family)
LFEIELPIVNAAMGGKTTATFAAAVSEAGGLERSDLLVHRLREFTMKVAAARRLMK